MINHLICVTSYNRLDFTLMCLDNLYRNTITPFRLVIVDNGSGKEVTDRIEDFISGIGNVTLIKNPENIGISKALNIALSVREPHQTFTKLDNDILIFGKNTWLQDNNRIFSKDETIGSIGGKMYDLGLTCVYKENNNEYSDYLPDGACGACITYRPEVLEKLGNFKEEYGLYGFEDSDYLRHMQALGYNSVYNLNIECAHIDRVRDPDYQAWKQNYVQTNVSLYRANAEKYFKERK